MRALAGWLRILLVLPGLQVALAQPPLPQNPAPKSPLLSTRSVQLNRVLPVEEAFKLTSLIEGSALVLDWQIAPDHYLYRKSLQLSLPDGTLIPTPALPEADVISDEFFGETAVYFETLQLSIPLQQLPARDGQLQLELEYQGCAKDLYCYPPHHLSLQLALP